MLKYQATAIALKLFDLNGLTRKIYEKLGKRFGARSKPHRVVSNIRKAEWLRQKWLKYRLPRDDVRVGIEVGTGWVHFSSLYLRLFEDITLTLYDVQDNRRFSALKATFAEIRKELLSENIVSSDEASRVLPMLDAIDGMTTFEELYRYLPANYVCSDTGILKELPDAKYDVLFSVDVLEHVRFDKLEAAIRGYFRVLKPGGISMHQVGNDDHLTHYDSSASKKQYLAYGEREWQLRFANNIQYINRASFDQFRRIFREAGFEELEATTHSDPGALAGMNVAKIYTDQTRESLEAVRIYLVHRKPLS